MFKQEIVNAMLTKNPLKIENGIDIFCESHDVHESDYPKETIETLCKAENIHFWFIARKEFILDEFQNHLSRGGVILEIGTGTGNVAIYLKHHGYNMEVSDMHLSGMTYAKEKGIEKCYQFNLYDPPFEEHYDAVCLFDVIEHLDADVEAMHNVARMLKKNGKLFITVPAFMWLWSRDDAFGHKRRYTRKELVSKVSDAGFDVLSARYIFCSILPLLFLRSIVKPDWEERLQASDHESLTRINPALNWILLQLCRIERKLFYHFSPFWGGSVLLAAQKRAQR